MLDDFRFSLNALEVKNGVTWSEINRSLHFFHDSF